MIERILWRRGGEYWESGILVQSTKWEALNVGPSMFINMYMCIIAPTQLHKTTVFSLLKPACESTISNLGNIMIHNIRFPKFELFPFLHVSKFHVKNKKQNKIECLQIQFYSFPTIMVTWTKERHLWTALGKKRNGIFTILHKNIFLTDWKLNKLHHKQCFRTNTFDLLQMDFL